MKKTILYRLAIAFLLLSSASGNALASARPSKEDLVLNPEASSGVEKTELGRSLLKYVARCALEKGSELKTDFEGKAYTFKGSLGLVPEWLKGPLSESGKRWVTACLLAHTNALGLHVNVSFRAPHPALDVIPAQEQNDYPVQEAAFYGNLFDGPGVRYVCSGERGGSKSPYLKQRVCSDFKEAGSGAGSVTRCNFISTGRCSEVCETRQDRKGYTNCRAGSEVYQEVITAYLKAR